MSWSTLCHWLNSAKLLKKYTVPVRSPHERLQIHELNSLTIMYFVSLLTEGWMSYWSELLGFDQPVYSGMGGGALVLPVYIKAWCDCIQFRQLLQMACKSIRLDRAIIHSLFTSFVSLCTPRYYYITKNTFIRGPWAAVAGLLNCLWGFLMCLCFIFFYWFVKILFTSQSKLRLHRYFQLSTLECKTGPAICHCQDILQKMEKGGDPRGNEEFLRHEIW